MDSEDHYSFLSIMPAYATVPYKNYAFRRIVARMIDMLFAFVVFMAFNCYVFFIIFIFSLFVFGILSYVPIQFLDGHDYSAYPVFDFVFKNLSIALARYIMFFIMCCFIGWLFFFNAIVAALFGNSLGKMLVGLQLSPDATMSAFAFYRRREMQYFLLLLAFPFGLYFLLRSWVGGDARGALFLPDMIVKKISWLRMVVCFVVIGLLIAGYFLVLRLANLPSMLMYIG